MMRTFVVPLDGSPLAERAIPYAIGLAQSSGGRLILTRAVVAAPSPKLDGSDWEREQIAALDEATAYLSEMAESLSGQVRGVEVSVPYGRAVDKIVEAVQAYGAEAVVMATHGRTGFAHLLFGSVTEGILASGSVPVFAVYGRPGQNPYTSFSPTRARLLVPQDGSAYDAPALQTALDLVGPGGEIVLVTVAQPPEHVQVDQTGRRVLAYLDQQEEARTREPREYLASVANGLAGRNVPIKIDVRVGDPTSGIAMAAIDSQADLIVMATHGRTGVRRAVLGSVAGTVLRTVNTPVVLVHPNQTERTANAESSDRGQLVAAGPLF